MRYILLILLLLPLPVFAGYNVCYDQDGLNLSRQGSNPINGCIYYSDQDIAEYNRVNNLISTVGLKYLKVVGGVVTEMSQAEKDAIDTAEANAAEASVRDGAKQGLAGFNSNPLLLRALADIIKDEINILRAEHSLPDRTLEQLKTAIENRIDSGNVD